MSTPPFTLKAAVASLALSMPLTALADWAFIEIDSDAYVASVVLNNGTVNKTFPVLKSNSSYDLTPDDSPDWIQIHGHDGAGDTMLLILRDGMIALHIDNNGLCNIDLVAADGIEGELISILHAFADEHNYTASAVAVRDAGILAVNNKSCSE